MPSGWSVRQAARLWARGAHRTSEAKARGGAMQPADHPVGPPPHLQDGLTFDVLKRLAAGGATSRRSARPTSIRACSLLACVYQRPGSVRTILRAKRVRYEVGSYYMLIQVG